jgi:hypothetical protein
MKARATKTNPAMFVAVFCGLTALPAWGQVGRSGVNIRDPGAIRQPGVGQSSVLAGSGVGVLGGRGGGGDGGILAVNMNTQMATGLGTGSAMMSPPNPLTVSATAMGGTPLGMTRRVEAPAPNAGMILPTRTPSPIAMSPPPPMRLGVAPQAAPSEGIEMISAPGMGDMLKRMDARSLGATRTYLQALQAASASRLRDQGNPITSLVPPQPSLYRDHMAKGDAAFRADNFIAAISEFQMANDIDAKDAESLICLLHGQFAISRYSYGTSAFYLRKALETMPELPLANLRPQGFFRSRAVYAERIVALEDHVARIPNDSEALLTLAYFRWFAEPRDVASAADAVRLAFRAAEKGGDKLLAEAAQTFWDGMVAAGAVSGGLGAKSPSTQPGAKAPAMP